MNDTDKTDPNLQRYLRAEGWFDRHVAEPLTGSRWTLAVVAGAMLAAFLLGAWATR